MSEEKASMINISKRYQMRPTPEGIREAFDLFTRYADNQQGTETYRWYRAIIFGDGEHRQIENENDFFFHYSKPDISFLVQVTLPSLASFEVGYSDRPEPGVTAVRVVLPSREHINEILRIFSIAEEYRDTSLNSHSLPPVGKAALKNLVLSETLVKGTRGYIEIVVQQINGTYEHGWYDACAVMIRRLIETLIIESFEKYGIVGNIKMTSGEFLPLGDLVSKTLNEKSWNLGRKTTKALPKLKNIGDFSAHSRRYNANHDDIDKVIEDLRVSVQELLYLADLIKQTP